MNRRATEQRIVDRLREPYDSESHPEPPEELRAAILSEVPERLELSPEVASGAGAAGPGAAGPRRWLLAAAASLVVGIGAGVVAVRVMDETPEATAAPAARATEAAEAAETGDEAVREESEERLQALGYVGSESIPRGRADEASPPAAEGSAGERDARELARQRELETVPTARDPWQVVTETPGVVSDRIHVGGNESGQQAVFQAPEESAGEDGFAVDGTVVTDMAAIGSSPTYYDFDQFEEAQVEPPAEPEARRISPPPPAPPPPPPPPAHAKRIAEPASPLYVAPGPAPPPSTGGTAEPNDRPYGDVFFRGYGANPFLDPEEDPLSTFALDVDTGSYTVVRRFVTDGHRPPADAVRVEEMVNAFDYGDAPPPRRERRSGADFALHAEGSRSPFVSGPQKERYHLLRFGIKAREVADEDRKPAVLTFVVDVSGSMAAENRLDLVKRSLGLLLDELRADDRVGLVVYGSEGRVLLPPTADKEAIRRTLGALRTEGATNAEEGILLGYSVARRHFREGAINRLILCSDGVANVGATGPGSILERVGAEARGGIELTTVGFGMGNYNDVLMEQLANRGDGSYAYVDRLEEARRVFVENLTGTLQTVARDAKVQVEMLGAVDRYRLIGYENRDVPDERFRDDTVDAGEVGAGHGVTALYELRLREGAPANATAAVLRLRYRSADTGEVVEIERPVTVGELGGAWERAPASLRLASVVAELAEILRGSYWARDSDLDALFRKAQRVAADFPGDVRVAELAAMIGRLAEMETGE
jgi:Ca-activated chloride channel homolog